LDEGIHEPSQALMQLEGQNKKFSIHYTTNTGPYRKLLPLLESDFWNQDDLLVTADDDTLYPANWLSQLVEAYETHRCIICHRGHHMANTNGTFFPYRQWMRHGIRENPSLLNLPTGKDGVLYPPELLSSAVLNIEKALEVAPTADDLWLKWHTAAMGAQVYCINTDYKSGTFAECSEKTGPALYDNFNRGGGNDKCIQRLVEYGIKYLGIHLLKPQEKPIGIQSRNEKGLRQKEKGQKNFNLQLQEFKKILRFFCVPHRLFALTIGIKKYKQLWEKSFSILLSNCFDIEHYRTQVNVKGSAILHYLQNGEYQNLEPFPDFAGKDYLRANPDVADAEFSPFLHYILYGRFENRKKSN
ncbi:MAG: hypothetical protein RLO12_21115, partial [Fulvivirga sp.]